MSMSSKNVWRAKILEARAILGPEKAVELNRRICKNLSFIWTEAGPIPKDASKPLWAGYKSFKWEADPQAAIIEASPYLNWAYPRVEGSTLGFYQTPATDARWVKNAWGIWEPDPVTSRKIDLAHCVGILLPGVAFDRQGQRLGYGKGFYDRALVGFKGLKVGVAFSLQVISETLPRDETDCLMDFIVTDEDIIKVRDLHH